MRKSMRTPSEAQVNIAKEGIIEAVRIIEDNHGLDISSYNYSLNPVNMERVDGVYAKTAMGCINKLAMLVKPSRPMEVLINDTAGELIMAVIRYAPETKRRMADKA